MLAGIVYCYREIGRHAESGPVAWLVPANMRTIQRWTLWVMRRVARHADKKAQCRSSRQLVLDTVWWRCRGLRSRYASWSRIVSGWALALNTSCVSMGRSRRCIDVWASPDLMRT